MNKSENIAELAAALVLAQPKIETAKMDTVNPFFKSKYADLGSVWDAVRGALVACDLAVSQLPDQDANGHPALTTMLIHKSGQWISATYPLIVTKGDPQTYGSALTYARRYGLSAVLGVVADDDDDGNAASKPQKTSQTPAPKPSDPKSQPAKSPATRAPRMTADEWTMEQLSFIRKANWTDLHAWEVKSKPALERLLASNPDLHRDIMDTKAARLAAIQTP